LHVDRNRRFAHAGSSRLLPAHGWDGPAPEFLVHEFPVQATVDSWFETEEKNLRGKK
jgi:hypothetical protein